MKFNKIFTKTLLTVTTLGFSYGFAMNDYDDYMKNKRVLENNFKNIMGLNNLTDENKNQKESAKVLNKMNEEDAIDEKKLVWFFYSLNNSVKNEDNHDLTLHDLNIEIFNNLNIDIRKEVLRTHINDFMRYNRDIHVFNISKKIDVKQIIQTINLMNDNEIYAIFRCFEFEIDFKLKLLNDLNIDKLKIILTALNDWYYGYAQLSSLSKETDPKRLAEVLNMMKKNGAESTFGKLHPSVKDNVLLEWRRIGGHTI